MVPADWEVAKPLTKMNVQTMVRVLTSKLSDQKLIIFEERILFTDIMKSRKVTPMLSGSSNKRSLDW